MDYQIAQMANLTYENKRLHEEMKAFKPAPKKRVRRETQESFYKLANIQDAVHELNQKREPMEAKIRKQHQIQDHGPGSTASLLDHIEEEHQTNR
ncbi:hypothetical protein OOU_Y34scaffold00079g7 [Pyricularia oryzae Y34]|uniref:Uncharacterized protein n=1 Tax=Pyricularia oryzae (strain Y34) TaxID=1143189 RepID=A0AA97P9H8_PYRO3|nr:hypothetical protein OOU_Y34scaffold00079g7 [Pyricularia oryzae Y34]